MIDVDVCNMALGMIGAQTITSLEDTSQAARQCALFHNQSRNELLRLVAWNFAIKRVALTDLVVDATIYTNWSNAYVLPADNLKVIGLTSPEWKVENGSILANNSDLTLFYIRTVNDPDDYDALFTRTLVYHLASTLAIAIKQSPDMRDLYYGFYREALLEARRSNENEKNPQKAPVWWSDRGDSWNMR